MNKPCSRNNVSLGISRGRTSTRSRGFTLVEILMVVIILGIASAVVIPNIGTRNDLNCAAAARVVMADLIYAQNSAISTQSYVYVQFDTTGSGNYSVLTAPPNTTPLQYATNPVTTHPYTTKFGLNGTNGLSTISFTSVSFDGKKTIAFDELGTPYVFDPSLNGGTGGTTPLQNGSIVLKSGTYQLTVTVEAYTGALTVQ